MSAVGGTEVSRMGAGEQRGAQGGNGLDTFYSTHSL